MTDWATRTRNPEYPLREMQSAAPDVDPDATIAAIRRILEENAHLLPADVVAAPARGRKAALLPELAVAEGPDAFHPTAQDRVSATVARRGVLGLIRSWHR